MDQQEAKMFNQMEEELRQAQKEKREIAKASLGMIEQGSTEDNLIKWQLDLEKEKNTIAHLLKGHLKMVDDNGQERWIEPSISVITKKEVDEEGNFWFIDKDGKILKIMNKDGEELECAGSDVLVNKPETKFVGYGKINVIDYYNKPLNDHGVNMIMGVLDSFVNRNMILSDWEIERINEICFDLGIQLNDDIYNDYENLGMDTDDKRKKYPMLVKKVLYNIEASLRRGMDGGERLSLRKIMTVSQTDNPRMNEFQSMPMKRRSIFKPSTW